MKWTESAGDDNPFNNGNNKLTHTFESLDDPAVTPSLIIQIYPPPLLPITSLSLTNQNGILYSYPWTSSALNQYSWTSVPNVQMFYYKLYLTQAPDTFPGSVNPTYELLTSGSTLSGTFNYTVSNNYMNLYLNCVVYYDITGGAKSSPINLQAIWYSSPTSPSFTSIDIVYSSYPNPTDPNQVISVQTLIVNYTQSDGAYGFALQVYKENTDGSYGIYYDGTPVNTSPPTLTQSTNVDFGTGEANYYAVIIANGNHQLYLAGPTGISYTTNSPNSSVVTCYQPQFPNGVLGTPSLTIYAQNVSTISPPYANFTWNASTGNNPGSGATYYDWIFYDAVTDSPYYPSGQSAYSGRTISNVTSGTISDSFTFPNPNVSISGITLYIVITSGNAQGAQTASNPSNNEPYDFQAYDPTPTDLSITLSYSTGQVNVELQFTGKDGAFVYNYNYIIYWVHSGTTTQVVSNYLAGGTSETNNGHTAIVNVDDVNNGYSMVNGDTLYFTMQLSDNNGGISSDTVTSSSVTITGL